MIITKTICDFCGAENPEYKNCLLPVITNCDWTEGRADKAHIEFTRYDICKKCLLSATNIIAGFQGSEATIVGQDGNR